ncbi:DUF2946 family protein [Piscinibacter sp.]|uniref:DUF2946 family protein n=1 Tax=Piscinibacter sp. TaxID=1903157 RepID=UPI0039E719D1
MHLVRRLFRRATWLALVAMLGLALAPTLSQAVAASQAGDPWAEICSMGGATMTASPAGAGQAGADGAHLGHCPLCGQVGDTPMLPGAEYQPVQVDGATQRPALFLHAPRTLFAWAAARARAPPLLG